MKQRGILISGKREGKIAEPTGRHKNPFTLLPLVIPTIFRIFASAYKQSTLKFHFNYKVL